MGLITNQTPYIGKIYLKFEKMPYYVTGGKGGMLNKVHLDLGFTKLVSRFIPDQNLDGKKIDLEKLKLIEKYTWGKISTYISREGTPNEFKLENSFLPKGGKTYIGDLKHAWWYFKNCMVVFNEYPNGVAVKLKTYTPKNKLKNHIKDPYENYLTEQIENDNVEGFYGYSHRGGTTFKIGDRLYEEGYNPVKEDYTKEQWKIFEKKFEKSIRKSDDFNRKWLERDGISSVVPFRLHGSKVIKTWDEAKQAAINLSKHLS
jgi:hypothetical protein